MKNRKRPVTTSGPGMSMAYRQLEKLLLRASGLSDFPWKSITVKIQQGKAPLISAELDLSEEDLAAVMKSLSPDS